MLLRTGRDVGAPEVDLADPGIRWLLPSVGCNAQAERHPIPDRLCTHRHALTSTNWPLLIRQSAARGSLPVIIVKASR